MLPAPHYGLVDPQLPTQFGEREFLAHHPGDLLPLELGAK